MSDKYSALQLDVMKELANIGGGNAATSISYLINKPVRMSVPTVDILHYEDIFSTIMEEDTMVNAVLMKMLGDARGYFLFVVSQKSAIQLINMMVPDNLTLNEEVRISALKELVNILVSSYVNALTKIVPSNLITTVPQFTIDMFGAILSSLYMEAEQYDENILIVKNEFYYEDDKMEGSLYLVPEPGVIEALFNYIGI